MANIGQYRHLRAQLAVQRHPTIAVSIAGTEVFTKIFLFYLHERGWAMVRWGLKPLPGADRVTVRDSRKPAPPPDEVR